MLRQMDYIYGWRPQICNSKYKELAFSEDIKLLRHVLRHLEIILNVNLETDVKLLESLHRFNDNIATSTSPQREEYNP